MDQLNQPLMSENAASGSENEADAQPRDRDCSDGSDHTEDVWNPAFLKPGP